MRHFRIAPTLLLLIAAACGSDSTGPAEEVVLPQGSMSARLDGNTWQATLSVTASFSGGFLTFVGTNTSAVLGVVAGIVDGPGTYPIGVSGGPSNGGVTETTGRSWHAFSQSGSGTITIASISATGATGTFAFNAPAVPGSGASGTKVVTEGKFDLRF